MFIVFLKIVSVINFAKIRKIFVISKHLAIFLLKKDIRLLEFMLLNIRGWRRQGRRFLRGAGLRRGRSGYQDRRNWSSRE